MSRILRFAAAVALATGAVACGSGGLRLPTDPSGNELFEQAQAYVAEEKWSQAVQAFDTLLRNYPSSPHLPEARLGLGRAYYEQARSDSYLLAIEAFRNFLTYHPSHQQGDYAQLMIALSYGGLARSPDRDQADTRRALDAFETFLEDYPASAHRELALERMQEVVNTLAAHELQVADWQLDRRNYEAAQSRAEYALRKYPSSGYRCHLLYVLAESWRRRDNMEAARPYYEQIVQDHSDCDRAKDARERLNRGGRAGT